jgi:hypothetical protein
MTAHVAIDGAAFGSQPASTVVPELAPDDPDEPVVAPEPDDPALDPVDAPLVEPVDEPLCPEPDEPVPFEVPEPT